MPQAAESGYTAAIARGLEARRAWVRSQFVLSARDFAQRRGVTEHELGQLASSGDVFNIEVDGERWYPAALLSIAPSDAAALCHAFSWADDASKMIFLMRRHGALGGLTVSEAAFAGRISEVLWLAQAWERG